MYIITNLVNGRHYIGQTYRSLPSRWKCHVRRSAKGSNTAFHNAIRKYGPNLFYGDILWTGEAAKDALDDKEKYFIQYYGSYNSVNGYNLTRGGDGCFGFKHRISARLRMSVVQRGRKLSPSHCLAISKSLMGKKPHSWSKESRDKMSRTRKERGLLPPSQKGRKHTSEANLKRSESLKKVWAEKKKNGIKWKQSLQSGW